MYENFDELSVLESTDNGKPLKYSNFDVNLSIEILRYYAGWADKLSDEVLPVHGPFTAYTKSHPVGVVGQIIPWNFPLLMAIFKIAPVLTTGCTSVLKPADNTPLSCLKLGEILIDAGMPEGVINIIPGFGDDTGNAMVTHPGIDKIAFTGSTDVGKKIIRGSADTLKRVSLELGGKSPLIICKDVDLDAACAIGDFGCFFTSG